jgi:cob(I)alamin adenosyltransferase
MIIYYYGTGKGKTTAGLGALIRAKGGGKKNLLVQFLKHNTIESKGLNGVCFGDSSFITSTPKTQHFEFARLGFEYFKEQAKKHDLIMLDELGVVLYYNLLDKKEVLEAISKFKGEGYPVLIITGRPKIKALFDIADIVTEMKEKKHIYSAGVKALKGIDY